MPSSRSLVLFFQDTGEDQLLHHCYQEITSYYKGWLEGIFAQAHCGCQFSEYLSIIQISLFLNPHIVISICWTWIFSLHPLLPLSNAYRLRYSMKDMSQQCRCEECREAGQDWSGNNSSKSYLLWYVQLVYDYVFLRKSHCSYLWWWMDGQQSIATSTHLSPSSTSTRHLIHLNYGSSRATLSTSSTLLGITQGSEWVKNLLKSSQNLGCRKR